MIENRDTVLTELESPQTGSAEAHWGARDLSTEPVDVRGRRILLVDDDKPLRDIVRLMLELEGHNVTEAVDGAEALRLFTMGVFDVVITDFEMPRMKGNELAAAIKLTAPSLPILMITASERAMRESANSVDALMHKPFTVTELHGALKKVLSARPAPAQRETVPNMERPSANFAPEPQAVLHL